jgi:hypothetical protein
MVEKLASAIYNDVVAGLVGITSNPTISIDQLEDDVVDERLQIIKEYSLKNIVPVKDLIVAINCIDVDCLALDKCPCGVDGNPSEQPERHFQLPQTVNDLAGDAIDFIGSTDKSEQYKIYTDTSFQYHKYLRRGSEKPYVYVQTTPNENNMYDAWLFNAPFVKKISAIIIPKDPRQIKQYSCCNYEELENASFISTEIKKRLTEKKLRYYRQLYQPPVPNNQAPK